MDSTILDETARSVAWATRIERIAIIFRSIGIMMDLFAQQRPGLWSVGVYHQPIADQAVMLLKDQVLRRKTHGTSTAPNGSTDGIPPLIERTARPDTAP
jgi:hypothetical protein